jgi:hypothetical protein
MGYEDNGCSLFLCSTGPDLDAFVRIRSITMDMLIMRDLL